MFQRIQQSWNQFRGDQPGSRFQHMYQRRQQRHQGQRDLAKPFYTLLGAMLVLGGLVLMPMPGPGSIIAVLGLGLIGSMYKGVATLLDKVEVRLRALLQWAKQVWEKLAIGWKIAVGGLIAASAAVLGYGLYIFVFERIV